MLTQLESIEVRCIALFEGKDQLMAGSIEGAHAAIVFDPDYEVLEFIIDVVAGIYDILHMPPVHKDVVDGTNMAVCRHIGERSLGGLPYPTS